MFFGNAMKQPCHLSCPLVDTISKVNRKGFRAPYNAFHHLRPSEGHSSRLFSSSRAAWLGTEVCSKPCRFYVPVLTVHVGVWAVSHSHSHTQMYISLFISAVSNSYAKLNLTQNYYFIY